MTYYVCFATELEVPDYVGPFDSEEDAADYADYQNQGLANNGIPSWVACYWVV